MELNSPALGISNVVRGRKRPDGRERHLIDPKERSEEGGIPEQVVLKRWRKRSMRKQTSGGVRLGPTVWRVIGLAFGNDARRIISLSEEEVAQTIAAKREQLKSTCLKLPATKAVYIMIQSLGVRRLEKILNRHLIEDSGRKSGTP